MNKTTIVCNEAHSTNHTHCMQKFYILQKMVPQFGNSEPVMRLCITCMAAEVNVWSATRLCMLQIHYVWAVLSRRQQNPYYKYNTHYRLAYAGSLCEFHSATLFAWQCLLYSHHYPCFIKPHLSASSVFLHLVCPLICQRIFIMP